IFEELPAPPPSDLIPLTSHQVPSITTYTNDNIENHEFYLSDDTQREAKSKELENECNKQVLTKHVSLDTEMIETVSQAVSATNDSSPTSSNSNKSSISTTAGIPRGKKLTP
ncbi:unnamed protein product, partial [Rotaria sordida]